MKIQIWLVYTLEKKSVGSIWPLLLGEVSLRQLKKQKPHRSWPWCVHHTILKDLVFPNETVAKRVL